MADKNPRLPNNSQRAAIVGRTGSGKTVAALWHLSLRDFERQPWVVYDFKGDENINDIENARHVDVSWTPGKKDTGIFIVHPTPDQTEEVNNQLWRIWERGNCGIYADEGYMINCPAFDAILTQGRSKRIPVIVLSQRPVWMSRFVFSEADFYQVFNLNDQRDKKTILSFVPLPNNFRLPDYHSFYYDVGRDTLHTFGPVPQASELVATISEKLRTRTKRIL